MALRWATSSNRSGDRAVPRTSTPLRRRSAREEEPEPIPAPSPQRSFRDRPQQEDRLNKPRPPERKERPEPVIDMQGNLTQTGVEEARRPGNIWRDTGIWLTTPGGTKPWQYEDGKRPESMLETIEQKRDTAEAEQRAAVLPTVNDIKFRVLSDAEWQALPPETQQKITANYAAYQAAKADQAVGGGSTANIESVMKDFGFEDKNVDARDFLYGRAIASAADINGTASPGSEARTSILDQWAASKVFDSPELLSVLEQGTSLLQGLGQTQSLSTGTLGFAGYQPTATEQLTQSLDPERLKGLYRLMQGLGSRAVNEGLATDPQLDDDLVSDIDSFSDVDPALLAGYFRENYPRTGGDDILPYDEFERTWLQ